MTFTGLFWRSIVPLLLLFYGLWFIAGVGGWPADGELTGGTFGLILGIITELFVLARFFDSRRKARV